MRQPIYGPGCDGPGNVGPGSGGTPFRVAIFAWKAEKLATK